MRGFAKLGHPGIIYVSGADLHSLHTFVADVKAMNWLALRVRFVEPLLDHVPEIPLAQGGGGWREFEKVGEVVAFMRAYGRERFVLEIGIGSAK